MRIGNNPHKDLEYKIKCYGHRVIIPVYIPNQEGYFKDSLSILKVCISSLSITIDKDSAITVVNNGCCKEVIDYLNYLFENNTIQDLIHTEKIGKLNSIIKAVKSSSEPLITITDADVKFLPGWLQKTIEIYQNFPKAGVVGIVPQFKQFENLGYNVIFDRLFDSTINFTKVKNPKALKMFYNSIGWSDDYNKDYLKYNLTISSKINRNVNAVIGSGHFVATYKRELFDNNIEFSNYLLGGNSETSILDFPCVKKDLWRLTTDDNYAYHMGNTLESWMEEKIDCESQNKIELPFLITNSIILKDKKNSFFLKTKVMRLFYKRFKKVFYKKWGLPSELHKTY
ncbi:glycosyltransferase family A protein [Polaribacter sargassicola]|uniref:glycosyltransferase family A protein n=1 Tax=Polaribacter sargassicola TaxID=2836891 RepID=UPI001F1EEE2F|nr:glycosyltransferase family A protein [Polaribacter sp. DS7-9]MCG1036602.1 glycosyltransferase family 2 protein [Polaribacter sp. DS7-9]